MYDLNKNDTKNRITLVVNVILQSVLRIRRYADIYTISSEYNKADSNSGLTNFKEIWTVRHADG